MTRVTEGRSGLRRLLARASASVLFVTTLGWAQTTTQMTQTTIMTQGTVAEASDPNTWPATFNGNPDMGPYAWVDGPAEFNGANKLSRAVISDLALADGMRLYVCRAKLDDGGWHPGKFFVSGNQGYCNIGWGSVEKVQTSGYELLVNTKPDMAKFLPQTWLDPSTSAGFTGGSVGSTLMRVCRAASTGGWHLGKEWAGKCNIGYGEAERAEAVYQVLSLGFDKAGWQAAQATTSGGTITGTIVLNQNLTLNQSTTTIQTDSLQIYIGQSVDEMLAEFNAAYITGVKTSWQPGYLGTGFGKLAETLPDVMYSLIDSYNAAQPDPALSSISWSQNRIDVFAKDNPDGLWHMWWDGSAWRGPENLGGGLIGGPGVASLDANHLDVFVRGTNNALYHKWFGSNVWHEWEQLGPAGALTSDPAAVSWGQNRIDAFGRGNPDGLWHMWWDGSAWRGPENLGGKLIGGPGVSSWGANRLDVFARGENSALHHRWYEGGVWHEWEMLGPADALTSDPVAVSWGQGRIDVFARGNPDGLWHMWWDGSAWRGPENLGGKLTGGPGVSSRGANRLDVFVQGTDDALHHKWWDGNAWSEWNHFAPAGALASLRKDRTVMYNGLKDGDAQTQGVLIPMMVSLAKYILDRDPATWTVDEQGFINFLQALAVNQRIKAAAQANQAFADWNVKELEKHSNSLYQLISTRTNPPPEILAMAKSGYAVSPAHVPNFGKVIGYSGGALTALGAGVAVTATSAGATLAKALVPNIATRAVVKTLGETAVKTGLKIAAGASNVGGAVTIALLMIEVGIIKTIEVFEYQKYVDELKAAVTNSKNPVTVEKLKNLLSTDDGVQTVIYWLAAQAATGTK